MNLFGFGVHIGRVEQRAVNYTQAVTEAIQDALGASQAKPDTLAVVESCVSLIADPFLVCDVSGPSVSRRFLHAAARDLLRTGNSVWVIDTSEGFLDLVRASRWSVEGTTTSASSWTYEVELSVPDGIIKRRTPSLGVVHLRLSGDKDWIGKAPWQYASLSASAMTELEQGVRDESRIYAGRVWTSPDGASVEQNQAMASTIAALKGGKQVVSETTAAGFGQGRSAAPPSDWKPVSTGQNHPQGNSFMRTGVEGSIAAAYGVPAAFLNPNGTAPALREAKRGAYLNRTLPLAALMEEELRQKLDQPVLITWSNLADQSVDVHLRARAASAAADLVPDKATLLKLVGLPMSPDAE